MYQETTLILFLLLMMFGLLELVFESLQKLKLLSKILKRTAGLAGAFLLERKQQMVLLHCFKCQQSEL
jgi:hypothetical protein